VHTEGSAQFSQEASHPGRPRRRLVLLTKLTADD